MIIEAQLSIYRTYIYIPYCLYGVCTLQQSSRPQGHQDINSTIQLHMSSNCPTSSFQVLYCDYLNYLSTTNYSVQPFETFC